jgi:hypothetical protein
MIGLAGLGHQICDGGSLLIGNTHRSSTSSSRRSQARSLAKRPDDEVPELGISVTCRSDDDLDRDIKTHPITFKYSCAS